MFFTMCNKNLDFEPWTKSSFSLLLEPIFCMRFSNHSKMQGKPKDGKTTVRNHADSEKLTPVSPKMSVFMKSKTSSSLPPYYSTEPKKLCSTSHFNYSGARRAPLAVQRWLRNSQFESIIFIIFLAFPAHFWNI